MPQPAQALTTTVAPASLARYQIHPYPAALIDTRCARDGRRFTLRPVLPQDEDLLADLMDRLSPAARRNRFHGAVRLSRAHLRQMCQVDYAGQLGLVVTTQNQGVERLLADARYCVQPDQGSAEFALVVDEQWQRHGLGQWALRALLAAAVQAGLTWMQGEVLHDNQAMLALALGCGLALCPHPEDERLILAQGRLGAPAMAQPRRRASLMDWRRWWLAAGAKQTLA